MQRIMCLPRLMFVLCTSALALSAQTLPPGLRLWMRADTLTTVASGSVKTWGSIVGGHVASAQGGGGLTLDKIGSRPAIVFRNSGFFTAPAVFPVRSDYTMYVVFSWNGVDAANNMVSGNSRALYTSAPGIPTVLHNEDFGRLSVSSQALSGPTVVRVRHSNVSGRTSIALNGQQTSDNVLPQNVDSTIFIGSYQNASGWGLNGMIGEILIFDRELAPDQQITVERYLHDRYGIERAKEPPTPVINFSRAPRSYEVVDPSKTTVIKGQVLSDSIERVTLEFLRNGRSVVRKAIDRPSKGDTVFLEQQIAAGLDAWSAVVTTRRLGAAESDTMLHAQSIAAGIVFAVQGQSNSIFGDASLTPSIWSRTFGGNFSQRSSDTLYAISSASGNGGGSNVGAWALHLQNSMANQMNLPSLCISGGVGGTRIEQHLPDPNNRLNLNTIYGSWLYRVIKSGSRERITWMFWYQGESNNSNDDYLALFGQLRQAWKEDLPNLAHIVVVQIRPGCAGPGHAKLRDEMRRLESLYPDVIVHAASGLPGHDGCHYNGFGYATLGEQLFDVFRRNELALQPGIYRAAPTLEKVTGTGETVEVHFLRGTDLIMTSDFISGNIVRRASDAWFANNRPSLHPTSVSVTGNIVQLRFPEPVKSVSYVPDYAYDDGTTIYQGPWLTTRDGIGAITFHNADVLPVSVHEEDRQLADESVSEILDMTGRRVGIGREDFRLLPSGPYIIRSATSSRPIVLVR